MTQNEKKVVIEQPSFFPWCGYMGLISIADIFVIYDDVQFERRSWQSRNRIISTDKEWMYINVPTLKASRDTLIKDIIIAQDEKWKKDILRKLECEYGRTSFYEETICGLREVIEKPYEKLVQLNVEVIKYFCELLKIDMPTFMYSSDIEDIKGAKTDRLINILEKIHAKVYVTATGAKGYIEPDKFRNRGIELFWYEFTPQEYKQNHTPFVPYMSVIDAIFNIGPDKTREYVENIAKCSLQKQG